MLRGDSSMLNKIMLENIWERRERKKNKNIEREQGKNEKLEVVVGNKIN